MVEIIKEGPCREIRAEDDANVFIARYDSYFKDTLISLQVIHKSSAQTPSPTVQHYYDFGRIMGAYSNAQ